MFDDAFDTFYDEGTDTTLQLKLCKSRSGVTYIPGGKVFVLGDQVDFPDGAYLSPNGVAFIHEGHFVCAVPKLFDKWGEEMSLKATLKERWQMFKYNRETRHANTLLATMPQGYE